MLDIYKKYNRQILIGALVVILIVTIFMITKKDSTFANRGSILYQVENDQKALGVAGKGVGIFIYFEDIEGVDMEEDLDLGSAVSDQGNEAVHAGTYKNDMFGEYTLIAYTNINKYVIVKYSSDGSESILVFNQDTDAATEKARQAIADAIGTE